MLNDAIKPGDKLNIRRLGDKATTEYSSKLLDVKENGVLCIAMPIVKNQLILMDLACKYRITFYTKKGLYACDAEVIKRYKVNSLYVAELSMVSEIKKIQRREFFRFQCLMELEYTVVPKHEFYEVITRDKEYTDRLGYSMLQNKIRAIETLKNDDLTNGTMLIKTEKGMISDISGGGIRFKSAVQLEQEDELLLSFSINQGLSNINVFGKVITSQVSTTKNDLYENRIQFTEITNDERENIVRFILNEERKLRQKEKGYF